jgi:uncharacterized membrane protein
MRPFVLKATGVCGLVLAAGALAAGWTLGRECTQLEPSAGTITIPLGQLAADTAKIFCYRDRAGANLRFVLAREANGTVHTVFDACHQCYKFHQGFEASRGYVTCRYCGNEYKLNEITVGKASCVPVKLRSQLKDGAVSVDVTDLEAGRWLF